MFETGVRQLRMAMSMVLGKPINPRNIERLVDDALKTLQEFGAPGDDVQQLLDGPFADPDARREFQNQAIRRTVRRLARVSPYYQKLFASHAIEPAEVNIDTMHKVPVTMKQALQEQQPEFITTESHPYLTTRTTGTTGKPTEIWLSKYEIELWAAMAALSGLLRNEISPRDCLQINISSRATAAVQQNIAVCRLAGGRARILGVIPPEESLDSLLSGGDEAPTLLTTYPSYLALLVQTAQRRGMSARDFRLRRIDCGGEVLSSSLARAAVEMFGARINDTFGMTEILPVSGRVCSQGHLHPDLNMGFVEVIDLETGETAAPGALGTIVVTPYYPYRECMPVFRYDTRDVVRQLPDEPLTCDLAGTPGTSRILGKAEHMLRVDERVITLRDLVEMIEGLPSQVWPARFSAQVVNNEIELILPAQVLNGISGEEVERRFHVSGIEMHVVSDSLSDQDILRLRPLRADLLETTFAARRN
ncbi:MAG TPA: AMP-binding protein [Ktedonobacteraceae bacterium]|nr:AMP-binding protein [Ktedonobacteraceae bacterium]